MQEPHPVPAQKPEEIRGWAGVDDALYKIGGADVHEYNSMPCNVIYMCFNPINGGLVWSDRTFWGRYSTSEHSMWSETTNAMEVRNRFGFSSSFNEETSCCGKVLGLNYTRYESTCH